MQPNIIITSVKKTLMFLQRNSIIVPLHVQQRSKFDAKEEDYELFVPSVVSPLHTVYIMW